MFKSFLSKALLVILMGAGMCTVEASAQGFLKKAKAAVSSVTSSSSDATTTAAADTTSNKLNKDDIPVYHCEMVYLKDEAGNDVLNADGTKAYRVYLVNQKGQKITSEAAAAQSKQINKAILTIAGKVGLGAAIGGLSGGKEGVLVGVATGLGMSVSDIMLIVKLKKDINKQKKVLEAYQK